MIVCHCRAVSDRVIRAEIEQGAAVEDEIIERCGAGSHCGGCLPALQRLLAQHDRPARERASVPVPA